MPLQKLIARTTRILATAAVLGALCYALLQVGPAHLFARSIAISAILVVGIVAVASRQDKEAALIVFSVSLVFAWLLPLVGALIYSVWLTLRDIVLWALALKSGPGSAFVGASLVLLIGVALFWFRLRFRATYGLTEVLVGVAIAAHRFGKDYEKLTSVDVDFYFFFLTAAVYLVVRGLDNAHQGTTKAPIDLLYVELLKKTQTVEGPNTASDSQAAGSSRAQAGTSKSEAKRHLMD